MRKRGQCGLAIDEASIPMLIEFRHPHG
jgi:hypothetical protein